MARVAIALWRRGQFDFTVWLIIAARQFAWLNTHSLVVDVRALQCVLYVCVQKKHQPSSVSERSDIILGFGSTQTNLYSSQQGKWLGFLHVNSLITLLCVWRARVYKDERARANSKRQYALGQCPHTHPFRWVLIRNDFFLFPWGHIHSIRPAEEIFLENRFLWCCFVCLCVLNLNVFALFVRLYTSRHATLTTSMQISIALCLQPPSRY